MLLNFFPTSLHIFCGSTQVAGSIFGIRLYDSYELVENYYKNMFQIKTTLPTVRCFATAAAAAPKKAAAAPPTKTRK